jgi:hypothetical protein
MADMTTLNRRSVKPDAQMAVMKARHAAALVRLWLSLIAYNLGNLWRRLALPTRVATWSLTSLQQRLVKTGGQLIQHARYYWLMLAKSHMTRRLFAGMLAKIAMLPSPAG